MELTFWQLMGLLIVVMYLLGLLARLGDNKKLGGGRYTWRELLLWPIVSHREWAGRPKASK